MEPVSPSRVTFALTSEQEQQQATTHHQATSTFDDPMTTSTTPSDPSSSITAPSSPLLRRNMRHSESITGVADLDQQDVEDTTLKPAATTNSPFAQAGYTNVTSQGRVLFATDEWFATADNILKDTPPVFDPDAYCEQGKVMDGWETRRRREVGHDWCVIRLPHRATVWAIEVDTAYFTGNNAPSISLETADVTCSAAETCMVSGFPGALERLLHGCVQGTGATPEEVMQAEEACRSVSWEELLCQTPLRPGYEESRMHYFSLPDAPKTATHLRVNYFPDGGVARLRLWGVRTEDTPVPQGRPAYCPIKTGARCTVAHHKDGEDQLPSRQEFAYPELSLQELGGLGLACSNKHYGDPWNLIQSTLGRDMGDGWETARHPERPSVLVKDPNTNLVDSPLSDWCIIKLGHVASQGIQRIILDTKHFRGNYPESVQVDGCYTELDDSILEDSSAAAEEEKKQGEAPPPVEWFPLVSRCRIAPDAEHVYDHHQISNATRKVSHVRVSIYPDGGISRVRIYAAPGDLQ